ARVAAVRALRVLEGSMETHAGPDAVPAPRRRSTRGGALGGPPPTARLLEPNSPGYILCKRQIQGPGGEVKPAPTMSHLPPAGTPVARELAAVAPSRLTLGVAAAAKHGIGIAAPTILSRRAASDH